MTTLYGIKVCSTVKKARDWLDERGIAYHWFDYRVQKLDPATLDDWFQRAGWESVFNRGSRAYKALSDQEKAAIDQTAACSLILADTNFIKRPVLDTGETLSFGFKPDQYEAIFG